MEHPLHPIEQITPWKPSNRLLRLPVVESWTSLAKSAIYALVARGEFPPPIELTPGGGAVAWRECDIDAWIASRRPAIPEGTKPWQPPAPALQPPEKPRHLSVNGKPRGRPRKAPPDIGATQRS